MKLNRTKQLLSWVMIIGMVLVACTPEDGDVGPAGPIGPEGPIGPQGDDGQDGQDGQDGRNGNDGVANIETVLITVAPGDWTTSGNYQRDTVAVPEITQEIVDGGLVQVFHTFDTDPSTGTWAPLPRRYIATVGGVSNFMNLDNGYSTGQLYLGAVFETGAGFSFANSMMYKVVVIPPTQLVKGTEGMEWEELKQVYRLDDLGLSEE